MSDARRLYLLGAGTMARTHIEAARARDEALEIHAADPSAAAREKTARRAPEVTLYEDVETMLAEPAREGDLAVIATPPWLHQPHVELAARSGRHVLCEKPLLRSSAELEPVASLLAETGRILACCSVRFARNPATRRVTELMEQGALGTPYSVRWLQGSRRLRSGIEYQPQSPFFMDKSLNGGGVVSDWAAYDLTTLIRVLDPVRVRVLHAAMAQPELPGDIPSDRVFDVETHAVATLIFERRDGTPVTVHYERQSGSFERDLDDATLTGTRGSVTWSPLGYQGDITLSLRNAADEEGKTQTFDPPEGNWVGHAPLHSVLDLLAGRDSHALAGGDALFQIATLRALYDVAEGSAPITLDRDRWSHLPAGPA